jgi:hypothetical protein
MNTKENQDLAKQLRKEILALQKICEALEKSGVDVDAPHQEEESFPPTDATPQRNENDD